MCMLYEFTTYTYACVSHEYNISQRPKEDIRCYDTGGGDDCLQMYEPWKLNPGSLEVPSVS